MRTGRGVNPALCGLAPGVILVSFWMETARAQTIEPPDEDTRRALELERQAQQPAAVAPQRTGSPEPVRPGTPADPRDDLGGQWPSMVREGAFIASARGQMARGKSGRWYFVFDPTTEPSTAPSAAAAKLPPMALMPSPGLASMERIAERITPGTRMLVTGRVFVYNNRNILLPTAPPILERPSIATLAQAPAQSPVDGGAAKQGEKRNDQDPSIEDIIAELDAEGGGRRAVRPDAGTGETEQAMAQVVGGGGSFSSDPQRASAFLTARRGRVVRSASGLSSFIVDSGVNQGTREPPLTLLPCQNLMSIELLAERSGENATFTLSGEVLVYQNQAYLLLRTYMLNRTSDQVMPTQ